ncbi:MAG: SpoIID/LytB domain-containing protein [Muribaculaceae bacterium]|nr:SpoIID/LytB domain-containing protein [Muribaculaceae bacterium]
MEIKVGIKTAGEPILREEGDFTVLENMLIGDGFHWEKTIRVILSGKVELLKPKKEGNRVSGEGRDKTYGEDNKNAEPEDKVSLINTLPVETYLECVVGSEMNPSAPIEFLKAHAVISRSWVLGKILNLHHCGPEGQLNTEDCLIGWDDTGSHRGFHVCSDDHCQRYQGLQEVHPTSLQAIKSTANELLISEKGNIIDARFSKCCGGVTELFSTCWQPIEIDCIKSIKDPWCDLSDLSPRSRKLLLSSVLKDYDLSTSGYGYRWETEITKAEIESNLREKFGRNIGKLLKVIPLHHGPSRRIDLLRLEGTESSLVIGKELWIRRLLSDNHLYSSAFDIEDLGDKLKLSGRGWGHGVGLCQIGAANMASKGATYEEILAFYYPGSRLTKNPKFPLSVV